MGVGSFFFRGGGPKVVKISFFPHETKKKNVFFDENFTGKRLILKSNGGQFPLRSLFRRPCSRLYLVCVLPVVIKMRHSVETTGLRHRLQLPTHARDTTAKAVVYRKHKRGCCTETTYVRRVSRETVRRNDDTNTRKKRGRAPTPSYFARREHSWTQRCGRHRPWIAGRAIL